MKGCIGKWEVEACNYDEWFHFNLQRHIYLCCMTAEEHKSFLVFILVCKAYGEKNRKHNVVVCLFNMASSTCFIVMLNGVEKMWNKNTM